VAKSSPPTPVEPPRVPGSLHARQALDRETPRKCHATILNGGGGISRAAACPWWVKRDRALGRRGTHRARGRTRRIPTKVEKHRDLTSWFGGKRAARRRGFRRAEIGAGSSGRLTVSEGLTPSTESRARRGEKGNDPLYPCRRREKIRVGRSTRGGYLRMYLCRQKGGRRLLVVR